jgi:hypothetical protein
VDPTRPVSPSIRVSFLRPLCARDAAPLVQLPCGNSLGVYVLLPACFSFLVPGTQAPLVRGCCRIRVFRLCRLCFLLLRKTSSCSHTFVYTTRRNWSFRFTTRLNLKREKSCETQRRAIASRKAREVYSMEGIAELQIRTAVMKEESLAPSEGATEEEIKGRKRQAKTGSDAPSTCDRHPWRCCDGQ